ncbi:MAG: WXG100 family type VII secretion target [Microbacteriaceae bacterium]|uniref:WXG100 family type VII secretion target n=1 Tax=Microbacterium sp. TaxID=51671 RepID=UPI003F9ACAB6
MNKVISAEEGALRKGASAVHTANTEINREVKKVRGEIEQVRAYWTGPASNSFQSLMNQWDHKTSQLNQVLVTLEDALSGTERDQAETEDQQRTTITGLGSMMSGA